MLDVVYGGGITSVLETQLCIRLESVGRSENQETHLPVSLTRFDGPDFLENALTTQQSSVYNRHTSRLTPYFRDSGHRRRRHITPATSLLLQQQPAAAGARNWRLYTLSARRTRIMHIIGCCIAATRIFSEFVDAKSILLEGLDIPNSRYLRRRCGSLLTNRNLLGL